MQSSIERRRLLKAMNEGPVSARWVLAKCAAGVAVVTLIAAVGANARIDFSAPSVGAVNAKAAPGASEPQRSQPHRKQVFDERRARFEGARGRQNVAREAAEPANRLPLALH